jgi:hypothetical protein
MVRSVGLEGIGQAEIAARVVSGQSHDTDHRVMGLMNYVQDYVRRTGARITAGQTMTYGWTTIRFLATRPSVLEMHDLRWPFDNKGDPEWVPGVAAALEFKAAGDDVMRRNHLSGTAEFPHWSWLAIVCEHIIADPSESRIRMDRTAPSPVNVNDSGWGFVCLQAEARHDKVEEAKALHLLHVAERFPFVVPYTSMPLGCRAVFDDSGAIVWGSGVVNGGRDPASPYDWRFPIHR